MIATLRQAEAPYRATPVGTRLRQEWTNKWGESSERVAWCVLRTSCGRTCAYGLCVCVCVCACVCVCVRVCARTNAVIYAFVSV